MDEMPARMKKALVSFESLIDTMRETDMSAEEAAVASTSKEQGDKRNIRKSLVRHIVSRIESDFPGRRFSDLAILELGAGAGFFAMSYAESFPHLPLQRLMHFCLDSPHANAHHMIGHSW